MTKIDLSDLYTKKDVDKLAVLGVGGFVLYKLFAAPSKDS